MRARKILLVDDDHAFRAKMREALGGLYHLTEVATEEAFLQEFRPYAFDLVILDMRLKTDREGLDLLREIHAYDEFQPVIMISAYGDTDAILDAIESGALMFLHKHEFSPELIARMVEAVFQQGRMRRQVAVLEARVHSKEPAEIIGTSPAIQRAAQLINRAADDPGCGVVVVGEPGTGRELVARFIHDTSHQRAEAPFVATSGDLLAAGEGEAALLGLPRITGMPRRKGLLEQAHAGVLFLDDAHKLPAGVLDKLIAVLRQRCLEVEASRPPFAIDLQLVMGSSVSAVERLLRKVREVAVKGRVFEIYLPPLRERKEDIPLLSQYFLQSLRRAGHTTARTLAKEVMTVLEGQRWPGNVHELRVVLEFAAVQARINNDDELRVEHLPANLLRAGQARPQDSRNWDYRFNLAYTEVSLTNRAVVEQSLSNKTELAQRLGYNDRFSFMRRLRRHLADFPDIAHEFPRVAALFSAKEHS